MLLYHILENPYVRDLINDCSREASEKTRRLQMLLVKQAVHYLRKDCHGCSIGIVSDVYVEN